LKSYAGLPVSSEDSHYEYAYSHQETDDTGYLNPKALNTDQVKYEVIKNSDVTAAEEDIDNAVNYLELSSN